MQIDLKNIQKWLSSNYYRTAFIAILIVAGFLRFHELGQPYFWQTEIHSVWPAKNFLEGAGFTYPSGEVLNHRALITSTFPIIGSFFLFGYNEFAARLPSVIIGLSILVVTYILGKDIGGEKLGLLASGAMALDFWVIGWHTQARMYVHNQFFYIVAVLLLYRWYSLDKLKLRSKYLGLIAPLFILGYHNHISFLGIGPSFGIFLLLTMFSELDFKSWKKSIGQNTLFKRNLIWLGVGGLIGLFYLIIGGVPKELLGYSPDWYIWDRGVLFYLDFLDNKAMPVYLLGSGLILMLRKRKDWLIALAFTVPFIVQSLLYFKEPRFIFHLYPLVLLIGFIPVVYLIDTIESLLEDRGWRKIQVISVLLIFFTLGIMYSPMEDLEFKDEKPHGFVEGANHRAPAGFISDRMNDTDILLSSAPSITGWYMNGMDEVDYDLNYLRNNESSNILYDPYIGLYAVENGKNMEKIIEENSGWVVADENFYKDYKMKGDVRKVIINNSEKITNKSWNEVDIYRFD